MSNSKALDPVCSVSTAYKVSSTTLPALAYSNALQPVCQMSGVSQTATPNPSPSR